MVCPICISPYNKTSRTITECPRCQYTACTTCVRTYLLSSHHEAHCMNCRQAWDRMFMGSVFPTTFLTNDYKKHRADVLFERERSLFPETMVLIQRDKEIDKLRSSVHEMMLQKSVLDTKIYNTQREIYRLQTNGANPTAKEHNTSFFVRPCPADSCKGYLQDGLCGLCEKKTCLQCNVVIDPTMTHSCNEEDVANWVEINKNTRPCPSCHIRIHKISGCYQMWCPQCHTAFNYNTGQIEKGVIHNPHYYDFMRTNGGPGGGGAMNPCADQGGRLPELWRLTRAIIPVQKNTWLDFHRLLTHVFYVEMQKYTAVANDATLDLRKKYMTNVINDDVFKKRVQERDKRARKNTEMRRIWDMFYNVGRDMIMWVTIGNHTHDEYTDKIKEMMNLIGYVNENIKTVNHHFQSRLPSIHLDDHMTVS